MRLLRLQLQNFRSFADADLDFNADGLIGVRGLNGAGKSSLFEAIEFALYGKKPGQASTPVRRDGAPDDRDCWVRIEFSFNGHHIEVHRSEHDASLVMDGHEVARDLTATSDEAARLIGLTRDQFTATFYARQREVQAFTRSERRRRIEELLGLTRLREAARYARDDARHQEVVVRTLEEHAADVEQAKALLAEREAQAKALAPAAAAARQARDELRVTRERAWQSLTEAQERAKQAYAAESEAVVAAEQAQAATKRSTETSSALDAARHAAVELAAIAPAAASVAELSARSNELNLRQQAHEQTLRLRAARADAQRRAARLADGLANTPEPEPTPDALREVLATTEDELGSTTARLLEISDELARALEAQRQAHALHAVVARARTLDEQLAPLEQLRKREAALGEQLHELEAERLQAERALTEERQHRDEVAREGRDARCLRCRRPYGDQYESILAAFDHDIEQWNQRRGNALSALQASRDEHERLVARLDALRRLEGERASLQVPDGPLPDTEAITAQVEQLRSEQERLQARRAKLTEQLSQLKSTLSSAVARQDERRKLLDQIANAHGEDELLTTQLSQLPANDYDPSALEQIRAQLRSAQEAEARCARLRPQAEQVELVERRLATEQEEAAKAARRAGELRELANSRRGDQDALKKAEAKVAAIDNQLRDAEAAVIEAEKRALRESKDVEAAGEALKRARGEQRQLRAERRELRYRSVTAELLKAYANDAQRRAFPTLEKETAELLSHLSSGRYADVRLDENAGLHLFADGDHRPLKRFSGGEQDLANLCLRLALSRTLARQRGTDAGLIILDEVFGSQDLDRRRVLLEQLRELDREFRQVFIVSHFDDVVAVCDVQVDVERLAGVSRAEVHAR